MGTNEASQPPRGGPEPTSAAQLPLLDAPEHVLSTLESDGSRRWLHPRLAQGKWWRRRRVLAYFLILFFVALPHLRIGGNPVVLLDITARKFVLGGHTFLPTDTLLLALLIVAVLVTIVFATAITGRVWCGWGCPQTVYMEFLFRPIDRLFEGSIGKGGKPKRQVTGVLAVARFLVYLVLCMILAHTFLAYFIGTERLAQWMRSSPLEHPTAFLVMGATTGLMLFDFMFFREQLCLIACPYGRFQSVMLDRQSLIVAYDDRRGEPRKKGRHREGDGAGDCVDCNQCVVVCPTGIDIRDGLQMECVNCTQCIDACDNVMDRVGKPRGLIRYSSQDALAGKPSKLMRLRTVAYLALIIALLVGFVAVLSTKYAFDAKMIRGRGNPFHRLTSGQITNNFNLRLVNRTDESRTYQMTVVEPEGARLQADTSATVQLQGNENRLVPLVIEIPARQIPGGSRDAMLKIVDDIGNERLVTMKLLGPH
ncbi:MAG: cytochrome c oxidase accessory protein CcoG [Pirellulales bacterium]|nr:cytochrome c oxidase accessory protein CcoG [Pirellulales bacterium]